MPRTAQEMRVSIDDFIKLLEHLQSGGADFNHATLATLGAESMEARKGVPYQDTDVQGGGWQVPPGYEHKMILEIVFRNGNPNPVTLISNEDGEFCTRNCGSCYMAHEGDKLENITCVMFNRLRTKTGFCDLWKRRAWDMQPAPTKGKTA